MTIGVVEKRKENNFDVGARLLLFGKLFPLEILSSDNKSYVETHSGGKKLLSKYSCFTRLYRSIELWARSSCLWSLIEDVVYIIIVLGCLAGRERNEREGSYLLLFYDSTHSSNN